MMSANTTTDTTPDNNASGVIDVALVMRLIARQFPQYAHLPVTPVANSGWDNRTFHLGERMSVRLPSTPAYAPAVVKEQRWLPRLAPHLPLPIPQPIHQGKPDVEYPSPWSIYRWLAGEFANEERVGDKSALAMDLAGFLNALHNVATDEGPSPANYPGARGSSLTVLDPAVQRALTELEEKGELDISAAQAIWREALAASHAVPVDDAAHADRTEPARKWLHGDVAQGNLLVKDGRLCAVIDFGSAAVGDPACDTVIAWTFLAGDSRTVFQRQLALDEHAWARGRGWALWKALIVCAGHIETNELEAASSAGTLTALVQDYRLRTGR